MSKLVYKTRGNSKPQGKPRVYYTCHPKDAVSFFEMVSNEILEKQNCAIWYDREPEEAYAEEELLGDLSQMQLFVIPVTRRFLCEPNRARDVEIPFAVKRHIPILPLLQENGLEALFNETCGDLQILDKNKKDETAIAYGEKLEKFLNSVLIGDELAAKVRAAFDAYVFLSYRKKDRRYARELLHLIHENEFCRDIAIWYDEFLTPGENFNDAIADALEKSSLFAMAITPNLVNEENYVMNTEYPMARKAGKPVLPVEVVPTDMQALKESYEGIPACVDAHEPGLLSQALLEAVEHMAIKENNGSLEHNFFIGLAYLGGIDVEVDFERAVSLITGAAEGGLLQAVEKLVTMYRNGEGVARDYRTAIAWQEHLVELLQAEYEENPIEQTSLAYSNELWALGDYCYEQMDLSGAKAAYERLMKLCEEQLLENPFGKPKQRFFAFHKKKKSLYKVNPARLKQYLAVSYDKLGVLCQAQRKLEEAGSWYEKEAEVNEELAHAGVKGAKSSLATSYARFGGIREALEDWKTAKEWYKKSLALQENKRNRSVEYNKLGILCEREGNLGEAEDWYEKSLKLREELNAEEDTADSKRDLAVCYNNLGSVSKAKEDMGEAKIWYKKSMELREALAKEADTPESCDDLAVSYYNYSLVNEPQRHELLRQAYEIWERLSREYPKSPKFANRLEIVRKKLGLDENCD